MPASEAIVGRDMESNGSKMLLGILRSTGGGRAVVEGDVGVGKTTFVNYGRYLWETEAKEKRHAVSDQFAIVMGSPKIRHAVRDELTAVRRLNCNLSKLMGKSLHILQQLERVTL